MRKSGGIQSPRRTRLLKDVNTIRHFDMPKCPPVFLFSFQHSKVSLNQQKKKKQQQQSWWTRKGVNRVTWKKKEKNVIVLRAFSFWNEVAVLDLSYWKIRMMRTFFSRFFFLLFSTQNKRGGKSPQTFGNLTRCYKEGKKQTRNKISRWFVFFFFLFFFNFHLNEEFLQLVGTGWPGRKVAPIINNSKCVGARAAPTGLMLLTFAGDDGQFIWTRSHTNTFHRLSADTCINCTYA